MMPETEAPRKVKLSKARLWHTLGYQPHRGQKPVHASRARHRVGAAGRRLGKSVIGGHELTAESLLTKANLRQLEERGTRREFWIVGPEYSDSEKEFRVFWNDLHRIGADEYFDHPGTYNNTESGPMVVSMFDGKFIVHAKSAKYPGTLVGEGLSGVILAEAAKLKRTVWTKYLRPTLADFKGWSLWLSTPEGKNHFYEAWQRGQDPAQPAWDSWRMPSWWNDIVFPGGPTDDEILEMMAEMSAALFKQEVLADFSEFVGRVFGDFDEEVHVTDLKFNPDWPVYACCDYGWTNPFVWLIIQVDVWDNVYVLAEYRAVNKDINDIAKDLKAWPLACAASKFYPDPASPGDTAILEKALQIKANTDTGGELKWRLELIRQALKVGPAHAKAEDQKPRLFIDRRCKGLIMEMDAYRYPENKSEELRANAEAPMDKDDHGPEALGRFMRGYFGPPAHDPDGGRAKVSRANYGRSR